MKRSDEWYAVELEARVQQVIHCFPKEACFPGATEDTPKELTGLLRFLLSLRLLTLPEMCCNEEDSFRVQKIKRARIFNANLEVLRDMFLVTVTKLNNSFDFRNYDICRGVLLYAVAGFEELLLPIPKIRDLLDLELFGPSDFL